MDSVGQVGVFLNLRCPLYVYNGISCPILYSVLIYEKKIYAQNHSTKIISFLDGIITLYHDKMFTLT